MDKEMLDNLTAAVSNGRTDIVRTLVNLYESKCSIYDFIFLKFF